MLKYNLKIFSICKYSSGRLRLWPLKACNPTTICAQISFVYYLIPFFRDKYLFNSFEHSQNHIILLCFYLVYTPGLNKAVFYSISPTWQATCKVFRKLRGILWLRLCFCVLYLGESPGHVATLAHGKKWCTDLVILLSALFYTRTNYQLCRWKGKELLITA